MMRIAKWLAAPVSLYYELTWSLKRRVLIAVVLCLWAFAAGAVDKFVWAGTAGAGCTLGECWENSYVSVFRNWGTEANFTASTDFVYVRDVHSETQGATSTMTGIAAEGSNTPVRILTVVGAATGTSPGNISTGALVRTSGGSSDIIVNAKLYVYGIHFRAEDDILLSTSGDSDETFERVRFELNKTTGNQQIQMGISGTVGCIVRWIETDVDFSASQDDIRVTNCLFQWRAGTFTTDIASGGGALFSSVSRMGGMDIRGVDFSDAPTSQELVFGAQPVSTPFLFEGNVIPALTAFVESEASLDVPGLAFAFTRIESGVPAAPAHEMDFFRREGTVEIDTARTRTDGASDGTTDYSFSFETGTTGGSVQELYEPLESPPFYRFLAAGSQTLRVWVANTASLDNDEFWITCMVPNSAADDSKAVRITSRPDPLVTPVALTADPDASPWAGTDVGTDMIVDFSHNPSKAGLATCHGYLALSSERVSMIPILVVDP